MNREPRSYGTTPGASPELDHLRTLLVLKNHLRNERFRDLATYLDNPALADVLVKMSEAAAEDEDTLEDIVREWATPAIAADPEWVEEPRSHRDLVHTWSHVQDLSSMRLREAAREAPSARARALLEAMAARDAAHARMLRALL